MSDPSDLQRFVDAQAPVYQRVLAELRLLLDLERELLAEAKFFFDAEEVGSRRDLTVPDLSGIPFLLRVLRIPNDRAKGLERGRAAQEPSGELAVHGDVPEQRAPALRRVERGRRHE